MNEIEKELSKDNRWRTPMDIAVKARIDRLDVVPVLNRLVKEGKAVRDRRNGHYKYMDETLKAMKILSTMEIPKNIEPLRHDVWKNHLKAVARTSQQKALMALAQSKKEDKRDKEMADCFKTTAAKIILGIIIVYCAVASTVMWYMIFSRLGL